MADKDKHKEKVEDKQQRVQQQQMGKEQAFGIIKQVCNAYKGNLEEHTMILQALEVLKQ